MIKSLLLKKMNQKGVALILAMFTIVLISYLAVELSSETSIEAIVNGHAIHHVKAYYAARAGVEISLFRIKLYSQIMQQLPPEAKSIVKPEQIDMILWQMPWPPPNLEEKKPAAKKKTTDDAEPEEGNKMEASYTATITEEGSKIDVNDLNAPSKAIRDSVRKQLMKIFEDKRRDDQNWARMNSDLNVEQLINNIQDWVSPGRQSASGGDKRSHYANLGENYPPNRAFRSVNEVRLVPGMTEDAFALLRDQITVFGMKAINPNHASKEVLMSIDTTITAKIADEIIKRRTDDALGGPFRDAKDFWTYVGNIGARVEPEIEQNTPIICDSIYNFKITSTGLINGVTSEITTVVFDIQKSANQIVKSMQNQAQQQGAGGAGSSTPNPQQQPKTKTAPAKGPPRIVYWNER